MNVEGIPATLATASSVRWRLQAVVAHVDDRLLREDCGGAQAGLPGPWQCLRRMRAAVVWIVGGWGDLGRAVARRLLLGLHALPETAVQLQLLCVGSANEGPDGHVLCEDLTVDTATGVATRAVCCKARQSTPAFVSMPMPQHDSEWMSVPMAGLGTLSVSPRRRIEARRCRSGWRASGVMARTRDWSRCMSVAARPCASSP